MSHARPHEAIETAFLEPEAVLYDDRTKSVVRLNPSATAVWLLLDEASAPADIAAELVVRSFAAGRVVLRSEVVSWVADVAGLLPVDHPAIDTVRGALADGLSTTGRLDEAVRIGDEVVARAGDSLAALPALEGLADAALAALDAATALAPIYPAWWDPAMGIPGPTDLLEENS